MKKSKLTCKMCALHLFPGHGHLNRDGSVKTKSKLRWL